ncbi:MULTISPECIES: hypothetical protein, partial [Vibrio]
MSNEIIISQLGHSLQWGTNVIGNLAFSFPPDLENYRYQIAGNKKPSRSCNAVHLRVNGIFVLSIPL